MSCKTIQELIDKIDSMTTNEFQDYIYEVEYGENWKEKLIADLRKRNKILFERLHNSKRDNRTNRDRLRRQIEFYREDRDFYYGLYNRMWDDKAREEIKK